MGRGRSGNVGQCIEPHQNYIGRTVGDALYDYTHVLIVCGNNVFKTLHKTESSFVNGAQA